MTEFVARFQHPSTAIYTQLHTEMQRRMEDNLAVVESLFRIVLLRGKQGLPMRGHRDDCIVLEGKDEDKVNEGNFLELVRFRAETDEKMTQASGKLSCNAR